MIVLKFGSSVLRKKRDLATVVHEIYRHVREGEPVIAVVSALGGVTDALLTEARKFNDSPPAATIAAHLATGEARSVSLLALAIGRAGLRCTPVDAAQIKLQTRGPTLSASPVHVDTTKIQHLLAQVPVIVVPGFVGLDEDGSPTLLGRGGSDLTAVFLAARLGARCRLIKDVDGVYTADPNTRGSDAQRYDTLTWADALKAGGRIVQPRALELARELKVEVEVASLNGNKATLIGAQPTKVAAPLPATPPAPPAPTVTLPGRPLRVGLLGLGVVGLGVHQRLAALPDLFDVVRVAVRDCDKHRGDGVPPELLTSDPWEVLDEQPDVLVELIGGGRPAAALIEAALADGRIVVTANKDVVSRCGGRLRQLCDSHGGRLLYSAAVGGGAPVIESVRRLRESEDGIAQIRAAVSGTCNFILERTGQGIDLSDAIREAQRKGLAEADPTLDLSGEDLAHKLAILAWEAFGVHLDPDEIPVTGIGRFVRDRAAGAEPGRVARLVGTCHRDADGHVKATVQPEWLDDADPLAQSTGEEVVCEIHTVSNAHPSAAPTVIRARGAGRWPTTESVLADLLDLARGGESRRPQAAALPGQFAEGKPTHALAQETCR